MDATINAMTDNPTRPRFVKTNIPTTHFHTAKECDRFPASLKAQRAQRNPFAFPPVFF